MDPGAVQQFHAAQARLLDETYHQAWHQGVASYEPDEDPAQPGPGEDEADPGLAFGAGAVLLAARRRRYRAPALPDPEAQAEALGGARKGLDRMVGELLATVPSTAHIDASTTAARAGEIPAGEIMQHAERLAVEDWADSNAWRLNAGDSVAWTGEQDGYAQAADADGQLLEWLPEADERVCGDCEELGALPPMPLADWPTRPGAGDTICNAGCRCVMQVSDEQQLGPEGQLPSLSQEEEATVARIAEAREPGEWAAALTAPPPGLFSASVPVLEPTASQQHALTQLGRMSRENFHPDVPQRLSHPGELWKQGEQVKPDFDGILRRAGGHIGAIEQVSPGARAAADKAQHPLVITAPLKSKDGRGLEKVRSKYEGDFTRLKDIVRGTIAVPSIEELPAALDAVVREATTAGWKVTGLENRFVKDGSRVNTGASSFGYKDLSMHLVSPDGHVAELQINTIPLMVAKEQRGGHQFYDQVRGILEKPSGERTLAEQSRLDKASLESQRLYGLAERATPGLRPNAALSPERVAPATQAPRVGQVSAWPGKPALITRIDPDGRVHFRYIVAGKPSVLERTLTPVEQKTLFTPIRPSLLRRAKAFLSRRTTL